MDNSSSIVALQYAAPWAAAGKSPPHRRECASCSNGYNQESSGSAPNSTLKSIIVSEDERIPPDSSSGEKSKFLKARAEALAKQFENALNQAHGTKLQFKVDEFKDGANFRFAIVDKETGEVVRQFPPEELIPVEVDSAPVKKNGVLIDVPA